MGKFFISLSKWIVLTTLHERSVNGGDSEADPAVANGTTRAAQLTYTKRAIKVALFLLNRLRSGESCRSDAGNSASGDGASIHVDDIVIENFNVEIDVDASIETDNIHMGMPPEKWRPGTVIGVHFCDSLKQKSFEKDDFMQSDAAFQSIGLLLFKLFCRGQNPLCQMVSKNGDEKCQSEDSTAQLMPHKRLNKTESDPNEKLFLENGVPLSISRLVSDLMHHGEATKNPFESLEDIISELILFVERPEVFLHSTSTTRLEQLHFGKEVYGRSQQVHSFLQVAARVSVETDPLRTNLVLISGPSGSGKSFLFKCIEEPLSNWGFMHISAKFDRLAQQQSLSTIASAFNDFFASIAESRQNNGEIDDNAEDIVASMERDLGASGIVALNKLIPSIRSLFPNILRRVVSDPDLTALGEVGTQAQLPATLGQGNLIQDDEDEDNKTSNVESSRNKLHHLFRRLVHAISSPEHPFLLFLDDLQWADRSSLDLIASLLLDFDHLDQLGGNNNNGQCFLVVGTYRDNEVTKSHKLTPWLSQIDQSNSVNVSKINLGGMPRESANDMISNALKLPLRLTRALTDVIMAKTLGNPFHVKAFVNSLVDEKVLHYSLLEKRWVWDIGAVSAMSIDGDVAELLERKILQLPDDVQAALKVVSCLGSQINESILHLLSTSDEWKGLVDGLENAVNENILEKYGQVYRFGHDMLEQASYELMDEEECCEKHFAIGMQLISSMTLTDDTSFGPEAFAAIGQINMAKNREATEMFQEQFATLNFMAGKKSMEVSDFVSALSYSECGIAFLPETRWQSNYELSLGLYENASLSCFVLASVDKMKALLEEIFEHARCLEDKLKGYYWLIRSMAGSGSTDDAADKVLNILMMLGEEFPDPSEITPDVIRTELVSTTNILNGLTQEDILEARRMTDISKIWTVKYLALFILYLYHSRPKVLPLVAARVIKISASFGYVSDSAFGFIGLGHSLIVLCQDIDMGYRLGKMALLLLDGLNANESRPRVIYWYCVLFAFWKEPVQAIVEMVRENEKECLAAGDIEYAGLLSFTRCRFSFYAGQELSLAEKECSHAATMMARFQQLNIQVALTVLNLATLELIGSKQDPFEKFGRGFPIKNENQLFHYAVNNNKTSIANALYLKKLVCAFWFKRYVEAAEIAQKYDNSRLFGIGDVLHIFYEGMAALYCARCGSDELQWMEVAEKALTSYQTFVQHSCWNFEHRLLLLEAEWHFTKNEIDKAEEKYEAAIDSAQKHRFISEEGLANDLYSTFCTANGKNDKAMKHISQARACYEKWGAHALVDLLDGMNNLSHN